MKKFDQMKKIIAPVLSSLFFLSLFSIIFALPSPAFADDDLKLSKHTSPKSVKPGRENVKITAEGEIDGDINLSSVRIILSPESGHVGQTIEIPADRITMTPKGKKKNHDRDDDEDDDKDRKKKGKKEKDNKKHARENHEKKKKHEKHEKQKIRFFFTLPSNFDVSEKTHYRASVRGTTIDGDSFESSNSSRMKIIPLDDVPQQASININPTNNGLNTALSVTITGTNTNFGTGTTSASFGAGTSVGGASAGALGPVTVISPTEAVAQISIQSGSIPGERDVMVSSGTNNYTLAGGFNLVDQIPPVVQITSPASGTLLTTGTITVSGSVSDSISGIAAVTVNGVTAAVTGNTFTAANVPLTEGSNTITASAVDLAGNNTSHALTVTLDITGPVVQITSPVANSYFNTSAINVTGTVSDATSGVQSVTVNGVPATLNSGVFSVSNISLVEGSNIITASATDLAGNMVSVSVSVITDLSGPLLQINSPIADSYTTMTSINVSGTISDALSGVLSVDVNGVQASVTGSSFTAVDVPLTEGSNIITASATDLAGNSTADTLLVTRDTAVPTVQITSPLPNSYITTLSGTITGTVSDATSGIESISVNGVTATISGNSFAASNVPFTEGSNTVTAIAKDLAGNTVSATIPLFVDTIAPIVQITSPLDGSVFPGSLVTITGTVDDNSSVVTLNGTATLLSNGIFTSDITLTEGDNILTASATDTAGNNGSHAVTLTLDLPPLVTITSPADLITVGASPLEVCGTIDDPTAALTVNGVQAIHTGGGFCASGITLKEGLNSIAATAIDAANNVSTYTISVTLDSTPPNMAILSPTDGYSTTASTITVTGTINDIVRGTVNEGQGSVSVNGVPATVSNRNFIVESITLSPGNNTITAIGADQTGNIAQASVSIFYDVTARSKITMLSGNNQSGAIGSLLLDPLIVQVTDATNNPIAGIDVIFRVKDNNGTFNGGDRAVVVTTDINGIAQTNFIIGTWAGAGNNLVSVSSVGVAGKVYFTASGTPKPATAIYAAKGVGQKGGLNQPLPEPITVYVTDEGHNPIQGAPVTFSVLKGGGQFPDGSSSIIINSDSDGWASTTLTLGPKTGNDGNVVEAFIANSNIPLVTFIATGLLQGDPGNTQISGVVMNNTNEPIEGVTMLVENTTRQAVTDAEGQFVIQNVPVGSVHLIADGSTAGIAEGIEYPVLSYDMVTVAGADNKMSMPVYLLALDVGNAATVGGAEDVIYEVADVPGFSLTVKANSVTFPDGSKTGQISVTQVHADKVPMVPQNGQQPRFIITIQPPGAVFDPPAPITLPNSEGMKPGEKTNLFSFDHDLGEFVSIGTGTVSEDGLIIASDPGTGVVKAGWHCGANPSPDPGDTGSDDDEKDCDCEEGSIIDIQNQILGEVIPVFGTPFNLWYKSNLSDKFLTANTLNSQLLTYLEGIGGWNIGVLHSYEPASRFIYFGNGGKKAVETTPFESAGETFIPSKSGNELYVFDSEGKHLRTLDPLTLNLFYEFTYEANGRLITITDNDGNATTIERDPISGDPTAIISPYAQRTDLVIDGSGYLSTVTNPASESFSMTYTATGLLASFSDPKNNSSLFTYDAEGKLVKDENAAGGFWQLGRTDSILDDGFAISMTSAEGRSKTYDTEKLENGDTRRINIDPNGLQTVRLLGRDGSDTTTYPNGTVTSSTESPDPRWGDAAPLTDYSVSTPGGLNFSLTSTRAVTLTNPNNPLTLETETDTVSVNGRTYSSTFNAATNKITSTSPLGKQVLTTLDTKGRVIDETMTGIEKVGYAYDANGRLNSISQGTGATQRDTAISYNAIGQIAGITDPLLRSVSFVYDLAGRITKQILPDLREINYTYDMNGNVTSITPPGKPAHSFTYTSVDLEDSYIPPYPDPQVQAPDPWTTYAYNLDKQLTLITRPDSKTVNFNYDTGGRLSSLTLPRGDVTYAYDSFTGSLSSITSPDGGLMSFSYDGSLLLNSSWTGTVSGTISRTYDNDFRITSRSINGANTVSFTYDNDGLLTQAGSLTLTHDPGNGLLTGTSLSNVSDSMTYNTFGEVTDYSSVFSGSGLFSAQYTRDKLGRITNKTETILNTQTHTYDYTYDTAGRLTDVLKDGAITVGYSYDANGNRLSKTSGAVVTNGTYDDQDRLLNYGNFTYTYTANGELLTKTNDQGQMTSYQYDVLGNLISVTLPDNTLVEYVIDGRNRRIGKKVDGVLKQGLLYVGQLNPIAELDGSGNIVARFIYGSKFNVPDYMEKGGSTYRIISDHLGSPRLVVDVATGQTIQRIDYDEFGNIETDTNPGFQPFGFAGGIYDKDTGLTRFGTRDYDPYSARWTSKDPIYFEGDTTNLFEHTFNDPINWIDTNGEAGRRPGRSGSRQDMGGGDKEGRLGKGGQHNSGRPKGKSGKQAKIDRADRKLRQLKRLLKKMPPPTSITGLQPFILLPGQEEILEDFNDRLNPSCPANSI